MLIRAKKASTEWHIRYKLTQLFHPNSNQSVVKHKKTYWIAWKRPQGKSIKVNYDDSKSSQGATRGFIIRNQEGKFIQAPSFYLGAAPVLVAEATAMRNSIKAAIQAGFTDIHIEGNNKILIQALQGHIQASWKIQVLIYDVHT